MYSNVPQISADLCTELDLADRVLRRDAKRRGHSHHLTTVPARRADGLAIGRVSV